MQKALKFLKENIVNGMTLDDMINKDKEPSLSFLYCTQQLVACNL